MLNMKKKNKQSSNSQMNITVLFGYSLFAISLLAVIISTIIPSVVGFFNPVDQYLDIAGIILIVAIDILPALVSYFIGDRATHVKNRILHHYNGVLFGIAAFWLSLLFSTVGVDVISSVVAPSFPPNFPSFIYEIISAWPIVATILVMALVAVGYSRNQKNKASVLQYRPYQLVLLGAVIGNFIYSLTNQYLYMPNIEYVLENILSILVTIVLIGISYKLLSKAQPLRSARLSNAIVAVSMGLITISILSELDSYFAENIFALLTVGLLVWAAYLWLIRRSS